MSIKVRIPRAIEYEEEQKVVIENILNLENLAVNAGPGCAKTFTTTHAAAELLMTGKCSYNELLFLTFGREAKSEIQIRGDLKSLTFNGLCSRLIGNKRVVTEVERKRFLGLNLDDSQFMTVMGAIDKYKSKVNSVLEPQFVSYYVKYQACLEALGWIDYNDQLRLGLEHLVKHPITSLKYLIVDEFHDTSMLQYELLQYLKCPKCVVYDKHQQIYRWRGADERNIERFYQDYNPKSVYLKIDRRSQGAIVSRIEKLYKRDLQFKSSGGKVVIRRYGSLEEEIELTRKFIWKLEEEGNSFVILARTNRQLEPYSGYPTSTFHRSKGREWDNVIIVGVDDGFVPITYSSDRAEEKNLFYVAESRAKHGLYLSSNGDPSVWL